MKKTSETSPSYSSDIFEENKWADWLTQNGRYLAYGLVVLIIALVVGYRFSVKNTIISENDYLIAEMDFQTFQHNIGTKDNSLSEDALHRLTAQLNRHPELQVKYQGIIAQTLINVGETPKAEEFAKPALARTNAENSPFYSDYSQTTMLIGNQQYEAALEKAKHLQQKMQTSRESTATTNRKASDFLYLSNFVRMGMLQQKLGLAEQEKQTWQEWELLTQQLNTSHLSQDVMAQLSLLSVGNVSFINYLADRERQLNLLVH